MQKRPEASEYPAYYSSYVNLVPEGDIVSILSQQKNEMIELLKDMTEMQSLFQYDSDKWTVKEVLGHIVDTERIMGYRLLCFARGEASPLPGFDENAYVQNASFNILSIQELLESFSAVRLSTIHLLKSLDSAAWSREGTANGTVVTVHAIASIIAGHELHHRKILKERYFNGK
ncbi:DinB family protein [Bacillus sp. FJAT-49705]|uniref:DinB family protein n=1 Tax=Cytobacillus citreus TaxID=2833586 RepID=A0ABS5NWS7_9BACI|nr:DinB family protein [Cytobacillus citreus]MBS4192051.1 DinB family protein [Cytobacillus citreus]